MEKPRIKIEDVRKLCPELSEEELEQARSNMERHIVIIRDIWLRLQWDKDLQKRFEKLRVERKEYLKRQQRGK